MVKKRSNVFGSSSGSDSDSDSYFRKVGNTKRKKKPPIFDTIKTNNIDRPGCENKSDEEEDYMNYSLENSFNENRDDEYDPKSKKYEGLKYDEVQRIKREEALSQSLFSSQHANKSIGLSIMEKMGFKVGDSLGNVENNKKILINPLDVQIKTNRLGVGASGSKHNSQLGPQAEVDVQEYRERIQNSKTTSKNAFVTSKAMKICFELSGDSEKYYNDKEIFKPQAVNILWRPYVIDMVEKDEANRFKQKVVRIDEAKKREYLTSTSPNNEGTNNDCELYLLSEPLDRLERLLKYMRSTHNYCFFCGCSFNNQEDLLVSCPGIHEEDHLDL